MERRPAGEEFAEDGGGISIFLCLLKGHPGVTQISKVSAADGINGRDSQAGMFALQGGIVGEARIVERAFDLGPCALTEAVAFATGPSGQRRNMTKARVVVLI